MKRVSEVIKRNWINAWNNKLFRVNFFWGLVALTGSMIATSFFFNYAQDKKDGIVLHDWLLQILPPMDVSGFIVTLMGSAALLFAVRGIVNPNMLLTFLFAIVLHLVIRMVTIAVTGFFPPQGLIVLKDPMGSMLYQYRFITRDLFYSGHTAIICLLYFCSFKKPDKYYILFTAISVGFLLLLQHVHYTIDVICAPLFAFGCYWLARKILQYQGAYLQGIESNI